MSATVKSTKNYAGLFDLLAVAIFVFIGRRSHSEGVAVDGLFATLRPFLYGLIAAGLLIRRLRLDAAGIRAGVVTWLVTVAGGLLLRRFVFHRGIAVAFVIVTTLFLGAAMLGWRLIATQLERRRAV
jgi:hypothetical protein